MIPMKEKEEMWAKVSKEFPSDPMLRDLHFIRELLFALKKRGGEKSFTELGEVAREEFIEWLRAYQATSEK